MRFRIAAVATTLLLPTVATAQLRTPGMDPRDPGRQMPPGRQPEVIARAQALVRSRYSVEAYPLINRVEASGAADGSPPARWTSVGTGTRLDWRHTDYLSWTLDLTVSYLGGPAISQTAEVGMRVRPKSWNDRLRPFGDVRVGFEHMSQSLTSQDLGFGASSIRTSEGMRYGSGVGAAAGAGVEYFLTNTLGLTTAVSVMRSNMTAYDFTGVSLPTNDDFHLTTYRLAVGLKYNRVRYLPHPNKSTP